MNRFYRFAGKRFLDVAVSIPAMVLLAPVVVIIAVLLRVMSGAPVLFKQRRPGLQGKLFSIFKFRTMNDSHDRAGRPLPDGRRLTRLGRFLRAASLDELPELLNVLRGDMSLVGPRPLLSEYLDRYTPRQARRHEVRPGITGWAQINGRNSLDWEKRLELDVWYVDHYSLGLDLKILAWTIPRVLFRHGITAEGHDSMPEFWGTSTKSGGTSI